MTDVICAEDTLMVCRRPLPLVVVFVLVTGCVVPGGPPPEFFRIDHDTYGTAQVEGHRWSVALVTHDRRVHVTTPIEKSEKPSFAGTRDLLVAHVGQKKGDEGQCDRVTGVHVPSGPANRLLLRHGVREWQLVDCRAFPRSFVPMAVFQEPGGRLHIVADCPDEGILDLGVRKGKLERHACIVPEPVPRLRPAECERRMAPSAHAIISSAGALVVSHDTRTDQTSGASHALFCISRFRGGQWHRIPTVRVEAGLTWAWDISNDGRDLYVGTQERTDEQAALRVRHLRDGERVSDRRFPLVCDGRAVGLYGETGLWVDPHGGVLVRFVRSRWSLWEGLWYEIRMGRVTRQGTESLSLDELAKRFDEPVMVDLNRGLGVFSRMPPQKIPGEALWGD